MDTIFCFLLLPLEKVYWMLQISYIIHKVYHANVAILEALYGRGFLNFLLPFLFAPSLLT